MQPGFRNDPAYRQLLTLALEEDTGRGDITSELIVPKDRQARLCFRNREPLMVAGLFLIKDILDLLAGETEIKIHVADRLFLDEPQVMAELHGNARQLLAAERVMLNLLQRVCGVATLTFYYVQAVAGTGAEILDTRKTMPGMRMLDKYAVTCGGGKNHRLRLDDRILIKDNHIALCGGITEAIATAREGNKDKLLIEVECDTIAQVRQAAACGADWILLDNMAPEQLREAVAQAAGRAKLEASGGVTLKTVRSIAETGVDAVSVGAITHSAPAVDIGLDIIVEPAG